MKEQLLDDHDIRKSAIGMSYLFAMFAIMGAVVCAQMAAIDSKNLLALGLFSDESELPKLTLKILAITLPLIATCFIIMSHKVKKTHLQQSSK